MKRSDFPLSGASRFAVTKLKRLFLKYAPAPVETRVRQLQRVIRTSNSPSTTTDFPPVDSRPLATPRESSDHKIKVGCIFDEFSYTAWEPEFDLVPINPGDWDSSTLSTLDLLMVESAWNGNDGAWKYQLVGKNAPSEELRRLLANCKESGIPTLFWNKEDPPHFEDFLSTAKLFDYIATSDSNKIPAYEKAIPGATIFALPFGAQPVIHNPARNNLAGYADDIAFAGTYFRDKFENRKQQMDLLLGAAHNVSERYGLSFRIFSRHLGGATKYQFPAKWQAHVVGSLPYEQMLTAYRCFKLFLNVNSVTESPSMCARRIFEIGASGTPVVTTKSAALPYFFDNDEVISVNDQSEAEFALRALVNSEHIRRRTSHKALRRIWEEHTYRHRAIEISKTLGLPLNNAPLPKVSILCSTNRDSELSHLLSQVETQTFKNIELCVLGHGIEISLNFRKRVESVGFSVRILHESADVSLGECLNRLVANSSGDIIAKFDDDDYYLPNYIRDQVNTLINMRADLVGKASIYFYLSDSDSLVRRWKHQEHTWRNFVSGSTLVGWRCLFEEIPFSDRSKGEDSDFLARLELKGKSVYSADSFNYIAVRGGSSHTWSISDAEILANSELETRGLNFKHVEV